MITLNTSLLTVAEILQAYADSSLGYDRALQLLEARGIGAGIGDAMLIKAYQGEKGSNQ